MDAPASLPFMPHARPFSSYSRFRLRAALYLSACLLLFLFGGLSTQSSARHLEILAASTHPVLCHIARRCVASASETQVNGQTWHRAAVHAAHHGKRAFLGRRSFRRRGSSTQWTCGTMPSTHGLFVPGAFYALRPLSHAAFPHFSRERVLSALASRAPPGV